MKILVTGGAGYIGSHMVKVLLDQGHQVTVLDNLSTGYREALVGGEFIEADMGDREAVDFLFAGTRFDAVMHFAAFIEVGESVNNPGKYYQNNTANALSLLDAMIRHDVKKFIFSSTAAVYGEPKYVPIDENHPRKPINPYGHSKNMVEQMLKDYDSAYGLNSVSLRYFNAAGAHPDGILGSRNDKPSHLIPNVLQSASGRRESISVFGRDYDTPDGTAVRDYIHIMDLCKAHLLALQHLAEKETSAVYNLGNGAGFSVQQVIDIARKVTGVDFKVVDAVRRPGDSAVLVADSKKAQQEMGWKPQFPELETIIRHAWAWEQKMASKQGVSQAL